MEIAYFPKAKEDLSFWSKSGNKHIQKKVLALIEDIKRTPFEGLGQPESLKYGLSGMWSRRIDKEHRIVYSVNEDANIIFIHSLKGHYIK